VGDVEASDAARLFVERARAVLPRFVLTSANTPAVAQICRRLDGIPLAIELAAARVRVLSVEQIAQRLDDRFRFLTGGSRGALPRQQTLRATLDWSYALLAEPERALFRRLAVFAGGFSLEAAEAVGAPAGGDTLDLLTQLVDKSLVVAEQQAGAVRYSLLETVRQYARERLVEVEEAPAARDRHRDWYAALAERSEPELRGAGQQEWRERLEAEHDNLRAALEWGLESNPQAGQRLAGNLWRFWQQRGYFAEGRRWLEAVLARASAAGTPEDQRARAWALVGLANMASEQGDHQGQRACAEESLPLFRAVGDQHGVVMASRNLGESLLRIGAPAEQVQATLQESLDLARAIGDRRSVGFGLFFLSWLSWRERDDRRALQLNGEALALFREIGDTWSVSETLGFRGMLSLERGNLPDARRNLEEGLELARRLGHKRGIGLWLLYLGCLAYVEGDRRQTYELLEESVQILKERSPVLVDLGLAYLGCAAIDLGRHAPGVRLLAVVAARSPDYVALSSLHVSVDWAARADAAIATARAVLGEEAFAAAWAEGQSMTPEQALEYALEEEAHE
jgi:non-specific serine/threonine protein kinase